MRLRRVSDARNRKLIKNKSARARQTFKFNYEFLSAPIRQNVETNTQEMPPRFTRIVKLPIIFHLEREVKRFHVNKWLVASQPYFVSVAFAIYLFVNDQS